MSNPHCKAELHIADDQGDNYATMICCEKPGHDGPHREAYPRTLNGQVTSVIVQWEVDDRNKHEQR